MNNWDLLSLAVTPHAPKIVSSTSEARAIVVHLPAGESLQQHEVHERAWVVVLAGEVEIEAEEGVLVRGGPGLLTEFEPRERHEVRARADARVLLLLTPWPGPGHPGAMSLSDKEHVRERAREREYRDAS